LDALARIYGAVLVLDEAHAIGAIGPQGRGVAAAKGVSPDLLVGTFGKAFGSHGAFVAGAREPVEWLWNRARSLVFSTGLPPMISGATRRALEIIRGPEGDQRRGRLADNASRLALGLGRGGATGHIVPWLVGADSAAVAASARLLELGYFAQAIRPPTVPEGTARLRLALGMHETAVVDGLAAAIRGL
jgi:7-keto-8-aminopelargonate synthetase-like enzyme